MGVLALLALPLVVALVALGPWVFEWAFGAAWRDAGVLARALAVYVGAHFVASPLAVVTMAWGAQAWALRLALWGQLLFVVALGLGLHLGGLAGAGWGVFGGDDGLLRLVLLAPGHLAGGGGRGPTHAAGGAAETATQGAAKTAAG
jgi:hypothetical protein